MRRYLSLVVGAALIGGGSWWEFELLAHAAVVRFVFVAMGAFVIFLGAALIWETLRDFTRSG